MPSWVKLLIGLAATGLSAWLFHGPAGYGQHLIDGLNAQVQPLVTQQELETVHASFARDPLVRDLRFSGPANDFQRHGFVQVIEEAQIPGIRSTGWDPASPMIDEHPRRAPAR